jgi:uncharacterized membrane protein
MNTPFTLGQVLSGLDAKGLTHPETYQEDASRLTPDSKNPGSPWFVRLFIGMSAWIASLILIAFLGMANIIREPGQALFLGLILCAFTVALNRFGPRNDFLGQFALAFSLTGQALFAYGVSALFPYNQDHHFTQTILLVILLECVLIWLYRDPVQRFISTLVITGGILAIFYDLHTHEAIQLLILVLAVTLGLLYWMEHHLTALGLEEVARPVTSGLTVYLLGLLILPLNNYSDIHDWWITAILLSVVLLFLAWQIMVNAGSSRFSLNILWIVAGCAVLLVPAWQMPGILAAAIVLLLGFWRNNRSAIGLAAAFLVFYLGAYYYSLEWTLLAKSIALMSVGATLFIVRFVLLHLRKGAMA